MPSPSTTRRHRNRLSNSHQDIELLREMFAMQPPQDTLAPFVPAWPFPPAPASDSSEAPNSETPNSETPNSETPNSETPNSDESVPRRRGWVRLDLDGNEIPSDEEEEFERSHAGTRIRAARRAQAQAQARARASAAQTQSSTPPPQKLTIYQNIKSPVVLRHDPSLSYPANFVDPLPMPLSEMIDSGRTTKHKPVLLPRHAIMAGR